jgi:hypothetical protein
MCVRVSCLFQCHRYSHTLSKIFTNEQKKSKILKMVRRGSLRCGVAHLVARRFAVRQARDRSSARHHREVFPAEHTSDEEMERGLSEWRQINVFYECD